MLDFHTHNPDVVPGTAVVNLPRRVLYAPETFRPIPGMLYSAGVHPWWTTDGEEDLFRQLSGLERLVSRGCLVAVGECGIDRLRGASPDIQEKVFLAQTLLARREGLPVTVHCVRAFDRILYCHKQVRPVCPWTIHGFRGRPSLARQLLSAGMDLSFGPVYNPESYALTPPSRRHRETDSGLPEEG